MVVLARLTAALVQPQGFPELIHREGGIHDPGAVLALDHPRVAAIGEGAGDLLEDVVERDDPIHPAILVDHDRQVDGALAKRLQQPERPQPLGHVERLAERRLEIQGPPFEQLRQQILDSHHPEDVVHIAIADQIVRVAVADQLLAMHFRRITYVQPCDPVPGRHQGCDPLIAEPEHPLHQVVLLLLEDAGRRPHIEHRGHLLLRDRRFVRLACSDQAQQELCGCAEQLHQRRREQGEPVHRARDQRGDPLRVVERDPLRDQLADHQGEIGDCGDDEGERDLLAVRGDRGELLEVGVEVPRDARTAVRTGEHPHQSDPDLHRREEARRMLRELQRAACPGVPRLRSLLQPRLP